MTEVTLSIIHFGDLKTTLNCLDTLDRMDYKNFNLQVIIINNDKSLEFPTKNYKNFKLSVINNKENKGFSGGHNQGFEFSKKINSDYHVIMNNDVLVHKDLIENLLESYKGNEKIGILSPKIYFTKGHEFHRERYSEKEKGKVIWYAGGITDWKNLINKHRGVDEVDRGQFEKDCATDFATGACAMISKEVIEKVKGFDERYFLYYEDGDLNMRVRKYGYQPFFCAKGIIWHNNAGSSSSGSELQDYYISRNRLLFGFKYAPFRTKAALFKESLKILLKGRKWQKIGIRDYYLNNFYKGSYPI